MLVADETSMIDVPLMHKLIQALPERAHLLTVGDVDQLPSFGPGSALAEHHSQRGNDDRHSDGAPGVFLRRRPAYPASSETVKS